MTLTSSALDPPAAGVGQEGIPVFLDKRKLVYSFSHLNAYRNVCPHQMFRRYIVRDLPFVETPEMKYGNDVHTAFEFRVSAGKPLPDGMQKWEQFAVPFDAHRNKRAEGRHLYCEQKLGCTKDGKPCDFWDKAVWFRGKIDLCILSGERGFINDWKSGSSKYEDPFELATGAVLLKLHNRHLTSIVGNYTWLKEDRLGQRYDLSDFKKTWGEMHSIIEQIEADKARGEFAKKKSGLCGYCNVADCENHYVAKR